MVTTTQSAPSSAPGEARRHGPLFRFLFVHEIDEYPANGRRTAYLALAVLATIVLYYTYYTQTGVTPQLLPYFHMSFAFYTGIVIVSNLIGAFASLPASRTDRIGRSNVVIYGLLVVGLLVAVAVPNCHSEWTFAIAICALGLVEGAILVATPALVRDFSPQLGRAVAMGFWTIGPVAGSLLVSVVANHTLQHFGDWQSQFIISGLTSIGVFIIALFFMKDLSKGLRDQLMVSMRDQALIEARARGLSEADLEAATAKPWRQILKTDLVLSALGIAIFLLVYYAASGFFTIFWSTTYVNANGTNFSTVQANGLNEWFWGAEIVSLIIVGLLSDRTRVRKPYMFGGAIAALVFLLLFASQLGNVHTGHTTLVILSVGLAFFISFAYCPWMAAYTETVEAKNPALVGTGLALWGWLLRLVVGISFIFLPIVVSSVNPALDNSRYATPEITTFLSQHPESVAFAQAHASLLKEISAHQQVVNAVAASPTPANIVAATKALGPANFLQLVKYESQLKTLVVPYQAQLNYLSAHQVQLQKLQNAAHEAPKQWQHWFWICAGGMVLFLPTIFLIKGRWSPAKAKRDEDEHEQAVLAELAKLTPAEPAGASAT